MRSQEIEKSKRHILVEMIGYVTDSVASRTIIRKDTGTIKVLAMDKGGIFPGKVSPFETFIQIIEGNAEIVIDKKSNLLQEGQVIIIPAHVRNVIKANERFKMISTVIKSGYQENLV